MSPTPPTSISNQIDFGDIAGVNGCNSKGLCQELYTDVAPPTLVGAWSMLYTSDSPSIYSLVSGVFFF